MTTYKNIFVAFLSAALCCAPALANNCDNTMYRRYNPDKCASDLAGDGFSFATTVGVASGAAALIGGAIALFGASSSDSGSDGTSRPTLPTYTMVGGDVDSVHLASIFNTTNYNNNASQYNDIRVAYSLARGYTGKNSYSLGNGYYTFMHIKSSNIIADLSTYIVDLSYRFSVS